MRKLKVFLPIFLFLMCTSHVGASTEILNNNKISISTSEYNRLLNLGFTADEIMNMTNKEYMENSNIDGNVVGTITKYYKDTLQYNFDNQIIAAHEIEVSEEEYEKSQCNTIQPYGLVNGYIETEYKKMTTTIISISNKYRYKITLEWKNIPKVRSYDIIGIGIDNTVQISSADLFFQQNFCYTNGNCSNANVYSPKKTSTGGAVSFPLPTSTSIKSLNSYLYFDVSKKDSGTLNSLRAYGDYAHAIKTVSSNVSLGFSIGVGPINTSIGINFSGNNSSNFDTMDTAQAVWSGLNW